MDVLKDITSQIRKVDKDIRQLEKTLSHVNEKDVKTITTMMNTLTKVRSNRADLTKSYHAANQDINLRNEEIKQRIDKMRAEIKFMSEQGEGMVKVDKILDYINNMGDGSDD